MTAKHMAPGWPPRWFRQPIMFYRYQAALANQEREADAKIDAELRRLRAERDDATRRADRALVDLARSEANRRRDAETIAALRWRCPSEMHPSQWEPRG